MRMITSEFLKITHFAELNRRRYEIT
jgi:hypothetical protein